MSDFSIYFHFPAEDIFDSVDTEDKFRKFIEELTFLIDRADCEKSSNLFFSESNKDKFIEALRLSEEEYGIGNFSVDLIINELLFNANNWEQKPKFESNENICLYRVWDLDGKQTIEEFPDVLKEITECIEHSTNKCLLINVANTYFFNRDYIPVLKDCRDSKTDNFPKLFHIKLVYQFSDLEKWFEENRTARNYNFRDNRHVKSHRDYRNGKSPIIDGEAGKERLSELLKTAITDQRSKEKISKDLINFDIKNNCYVWFEFENENPQNQYHGYHLVYADTEERNTQAENIIPERIKRILEYRSQQKSNTFYKRR